MKKLVLFSLMALVGLSVNAQFKSKSSVNLQANSKVEKKMQPKRTFQAVAPRTDFAKRNYAVAKCKNRLDPAKIKSVTLANRTSEVALPTTQNKVFSKGAVQNRRMVNFKPTLTLNPQTSTRAKAPRKTPAFVESYTGIAVDYFTNEDVQWTMTPTTATFTNEETAEEEVVNVLVDVIPTPSYLAELFPNGIPVEYTIDENDVITIAPQAIASFQNEAQDTTFYITLFSVNSDDEDGIINMEVNENGKLTITNGNWICFGEFANVEFDEAMGDSEAFQRLDELYVDVNYYYRYETLVEQTYNGHGVDYFENEPVDWVMQRGKTVMDDEETHFFINMTPLPEIFASLYPNGIDVEYTQDGRTITVKPQVIASYEDEEYGTLYIMLFSATSADGSIVLTEDKYGLNTIDGESILIGEWSTSEFDNTFGSYMGGYSYIDNPKYRTPNAPATAPEDVVFEPEETVLFANMFYSGASFTNNLAFMGAYAPTTFRNETFDVATGFDWSVKETDADDVETTITGNERSFTLNTKGGAIYSDFTLIGYNEKEASKPYTWGKNNFATDDEGNPTTDSLYQEFYVYAGHGADSFSYTDEDSGEELYSILSRQNPDYETMFYVNWATPDIGVKYNVSSMSTIYSYQGKPATPLYLTGVTLPMVNFSAQDDFNLHIKICKCERSVKGDLTVGDIIAEGDATIENVNDTYATSSGLTGVDFDELYVEDEFGMSETVDYLFIEDEFVIIIEGWDNGTFSGVLGSHSYNFNELTSTWFQETGDASGRMHSYQGGWPQLFIGLLDATYGYLYTEDDTNLTFDVEGGTSSIHVDPMYYGIDEETEEPTYNLLVESVLVDDEEAENVPEWLNIEVANEDYTKATGVDEDGEEYEYFVNGIDYDLVFTAEALPEGVEYRTAKIVFMQTGARLTVTITQGVDPDGISTVVASTPLKNRRAFNLAGQAVGKNYKGIVVKDGKKVLVK